MIDILFFYQCLVLGFLALAVCNLVSILLTFKSVPAAEAKCTNCPTVSILVPARNEARNIAACVESLARQNYSNFELIVLDDNSDDGTSEIARQSMPRDGADSKFRIVHGSELPEGWTGKAWACHQLAALARGEFLLFTDADTVHSQRSVGDAMAFSIATRADLLSAWPRLVTKSLGEKLVVPILHLLFGAMYPHGVWMWLQNRPQIARLFPAKILRSAGVANGQFLLFKKSSYDAIGGHCAVRHDLVEDVALGREVASRAGEGMRLINCDGSHLVDCRMYRSMAEVWEGFTKNVRPAFEKDTIRFVLFGISQVCVFLLPFVFVFQREHRSIVIAQLVLIYLLRLMLALRFRTSISGALLHPIGHLIAVLIGLNSWLNAGRAGVTWKGRRYAKG
jgi:chlorobactene glucosyltransferase